MKPEQRNIKRYGVDQESPNFFVRRPHKLLHNSSRAGRLRNVIVSGFVAFYQINTFS